MQFTPQSHLDRVKMELISYRPELVVPGVCRRIQVEYHQQAATTIRIRKREINSPRTQPPCRWWDPMAMCEIRVWQRKAHTPKTISYTQWRWNKCSKDRMIRAARLIYRQGPDQGTWPSQQEQAIGYYHWFLQVQFWKESICRRTKHSDEMTSVNQMYHQPEVDSTMLTTTFLILNCKLL